MEKKMYLILELMLFVSSAMALSDCYFNSSSITRKRFPHSFIFGAASSAYQYEGAADIDGRGPSIWDTLSHINPDKIMDRSNGDVAVDSYHRYKDDVRIIREMNLDSYRLSISWTRILPNGRPSGGVNKKGIMYYNNFINELISNGITPFVTLFHWDLPQTLQDEYGGLLSPRVTEDFKNYVDICFREFGDRVKNWITVNEPWTFAADGYANGDLAPWHCSKWVNAKCTGGDSSTEPYLVGHHFLLAHAAAVKLYKQKYQATQKGQIGITLVSNWFEPSSSTKEDTIATLRAIDFMFGWFMDPLTFGDYPESMKELVGNRLPKFTKSQSDMIKGSFDFIGLNYYSSNYVVYAPELSSGNKLSYLTDSLANLTTERNGIPIGPKAASDWLYIYPQGLRDLLVYTKYKYNDPVIYITENGVDEKNNSTQTLEEALADNMRVDFYRDHLCFLQKAINEDGVNVKGYFAWTLMDDFEWNSGYAVRFGLNYVDFKNNLKRYPKLSARWFKNFLKK